MCCFSDKLSSANLCEPPRLRRLMVFTSSLNRGGRRGSQSSRAANKTREKEFLAKTQRSAERPQRKTCQKNKTPRGCFAEVLLRLAPLRSSDFMRLHQDPTILYFSNVQLPHHQAKRRALEDEGRRSLSRTQKGLLIWSGCALAGAEAIKHVSLSETASTAVGAVELILAIATGIAFGLTVSKRGA